MSVEPHVLGAVILFAGLPGDQLGRVARQGIVRTYRPETTVINQDDPGDTLYVILRGTVKVSLNRPDGREVFLAVLTANDHFGELSLIDSKYRSANVLTEEETSLLLIDRELFHDLTYCREFNLNLLRSLASRSRHGNERVGNLARMSVQGLVAHHIIEFAELYGQTTDSCKDITIPIRLTQHDFADLVGATRERVNQVMKHFKVTGCITVNSQYRITVHDLSTLRRCVQMQ